MSGGHYHHPHHHQHRPTTPQTRLKNSPKQGPLKATIPIESVTKEGSSLRESISPETSPTTWIRSPVAAVANNRFGGCNEIVEYLFEQKRYENYPGRTSPSVYPRNDICNNPCIMRRTSSLDNIHIKGLFSRDNSFINRDKSTQTDIATSLDSIHRKLDGSDTVEVRLSRIVLRTRRKSLYKDLTTSTLPSTTTTTHLDQLNCLRTVNTKSPSGIIVVPKSSRSSEEGLNQEIESYISRSESDLQCDKLRQPTPEGRKAPVADLFRIANFPNPIVQVMPNYNSPDDSQGSSPEQDKAIGITGSSPRINRFMARSPPDGVERVLSKSVPILKPVPIELAPPRTFFTLTPSSRSAFESLDRKIGSNGDEQQEQQQQDEKEDEEESPIVPEHNIE